MNDDTFELQISEAQRDLQALKQRADDSSVSERGLLERAIEELSVTLEELRVTAEELRARNSELLIMRDAVDSERRRYEELFEFAPDAYLVTSLEGTVEEANQTASDLLNTPKKALVGKPLIAFLPPDSRPAFRSFLNHLTLGPAGRIVETAMIPHRREQIDVSLTVALALNYSGRPVGVRWLLRDVGERKRLEDEVRSAKTELEHQVEEREIEVRRVNQNSDEFFALVSHELRTPVTVIQNGIRFLRTRAEEIGEDKKRTLLDDIGRQTEKLSATMENLLVLARVELGQKVPGEPMLVPQLLETFAARFHSEHPGRTLRMEFEPDLPAVGGEPAYLEHIVQNLLSNAGKYTPADSDIELRAVLLNSDEVAISVMDRGPGIPPEDVEVIFQPFYRSRHTARHATGAGLGLTVCQRLVDVQSGRIWAGRRAGGGFEVTFTLPVDQEPVTGDEPVEDLSPVRKTRA